MAPKTYFYGVDEVHTLMMDDDSDNLFVGMQVQGTSNTKKDLVLILTPDQVIDIYNYFKQEIDKRY